MDAQSNLANLMHMYEPRIFGLIEKKCTAAKKESLWQPWLCPTDESKQTINNKQLPTTKWKRDRRSRTDYTRKTDHKLHTDNSRQSPTTTHDSDASETTPNGDAPLDMSVRHRGLPPSYNQAISDRRNYRAIETDATVTYTPNGSAAVGNARDELPSGISMCDPIIDEHFRRSLGKTYMTVFNNHSAVQAIGSDRRQSTSPTSAKTKRSNAGDGATVSGGKQVGDLTDGAGLSVDDHFAKALGDTWLKLNGKKGDDNVGLVKSPSVVENGTSNSLVTI